MDGFIGRAPELEKLKHILDLNVASFIVINGRRRIGKSRLIAEFAKRYTFVKFVGLPPREGMTAQDQRNEFMRQFAEQFELPIAGINNWGDLFTLLSKQTQKGRVVILFDEITWMAHGAPDFLGQLKTAWDEWFSKNKKLILFVCGSVSAWIEKNLLSGTAFMGRPTLQMTLRELPLIDCDKFWLPQQNISAFEKLKFLAVTGGVPRYLELMNPKKSSEDNIRALFFSPDGPLSDEFQKIFVDVYGNKNNRYREIVNLLIDGAKTQEAIAERLGVTRTGDLSEALEALVLGGFLSRDFTWNVKTQKVSTLSVYRLSDNYLRFSLKYLLPNQAMIQKGRFESRSIKSLPGWNSILALQFENLVLNNHNHIIKSLGIFEQDIIFDNPYFQRKTNRLPGCQVDYMIQTQHDVVFVCEIKFSRTKLGMSIIDEMKEKLLRLKLPAHISKRAVLIHVGGVQDSVVDSNFFTNIINFSELMA